MKTYCHIIVFRIFFILTLILISSCKESLELDESSKSLDHYITELNALKIAKHFINSEAFINARQEESNSKTIKSINSIKDMHQNNILYIVNYEDGGFLILSADDRVNPVLAFSGKNNFSTNEHSHPCGVKNWLNEVKKGIESIRKINLDQDVRIRNIWINLLNYDQSSNEFSRKMEECYYNGQQITEYIIDGPLVQSEWGQTGGYNDEVPLWCGTDEAPCGCVAVAMGQIIRYHEHPSTYNWNLNDFPHDHATQDIAELLSDIGDAVEMTYGCNGSGAYSSDVEPALENDFNYSTTTYYSSYSRSAVKSEISNNRPVYLGGDDNGNNGHAFVAHGFMVIEYYTCEENPYNPGEFWKSLDYSELYFNINWGWEGTHDGYYGFNDFTPGNWDFNDNREMVAVRP